MWYGFETVKCDWRAIDIFIRACSAISRTFRKILDKISEVSVTLTKSTPCVAKHHVFCDFIPDPKS